MGALLQIGAGIGDLFRILWRHIRIGCTTELLQVEIALLAAFVVIDGYRFIKLGLCLEAPFRLTLTSLAAYQAAGAVLIVFLVAAPLLVSVSRIVLSLPMTSGLKHRTALTAHVALSLALAVVAILTWNVRTLGGSEELASGAVKDAFQPLFAWLVDLSAFTVTKINGSRLIFSAAGVTALLAFIRIYVLQAEQPPELVRDYIKASVLADLDRRLVSSAAPVRLNFTEPILSADVPFISDRTEAAVRKYHREFPSSKEADLRLKELRRNCFALLREVLAIPPSILESQLEVFAARGRGLEVALDRFGPAPNVILSPFEATSIADAASWHCLGSQATSCQLRRPETLDWSAHRSSILDQMTTLLDKGRVNVLVISEMNSMTGMTIPVRALTAALRERFPDYELKIIVDGSQSVGNGGRLRFLDSADSYLFTCNKWLMAPEPCVVLLSKERPQRSPYDAWTTDTPKRADNVRMIAGLAAALDLLKQKGLEFFWERSRLLQETFLERIRKKGFEVVGEGDTTDGIYTERTLMSCVRPQKGTRWRTDFLERLERARLGIRVNNPTDAAIASVTIAFPYYLSIWHLNELSLVLCQATEPWGAAAAAKA